MGIFGNPAEQFYGPPVGKEFSGEYHLRVNAAMELDIIMKFVEAGEYTEDLRGRTLWILEDWADRMGVVIRVIKEKEQWKVKLLSERIPWLYFL